MKIPTRLITESTTLLVVLLCPFFIYKENVAFRHSWTAFKAEDHFLSNTFSLCKGVCKTANDEVFYLKKKLPQIYLNKSWSCAWPSKLNPRCFRLPSFFFSFLLIWMENFIYGHFWTPYKPKRNNKYITLMHRHKNILFGCLGLPSFFVHFLVHIKGQCCI